MIAGVLPLTVSTELFGAKIFRLNGWAIPLCWCNRIVVLTKSHFSGQKVGECLNPFFVVWNTLIHSVVLTCLRLLWLNWILKYLLELGSPYIQKNVGPEISIPAPQMTLNIQGCAFRLWKDAGTPCTLESPESISHSTGFEHVTFQCDAYCCGMYHGPWGYGIFGRTFGLGARDYDIMCEIQNVGNKWVNLERKSNSVGSNFLSKRDTGRDLIFRHHQKWTIPQAISFFLGGHNPV